MIYGGFSSISTEQPLPVNAAPLEASSSVWRLGDGPTRVRTSVDGRRRVFVLGWCGISASELALLADTVLPADVAWRWPGTYTVVEETAAAVVVHTDPAAARPVYVTRWDGGWAWCTSARLLASLIGAGIDKERLACSVFAPTVPTLAAGRTFFNQVQQLPPGARIELPSSGADVRSTTTWRPDPEADRLPHIRLREALATATALRADAPGLSTDLSGGLDSTSITALAASTAPGRRRLNAVTIHPDGTLDGADLRHARLAATRHADRIIHHLLPLTDRHLPYSKVTEIPATDEPAPSTLTHARLSWQLTWMRDELGTRTHLTGDGGDSLLFLSPLHLADLLRHGRLRRAASEALGWARLRHTPVGPLLRAAVLGARISRERALADLPGAIGGADRNDHGKVAWFPLVPFPSWGEPASRQLLAQAAVRAAAEPDTLTGLDFAVRSEVDEIREVARTAAVDAQLAAAYGVDLHNPFLDSSVVNTVLTTPLAQRPALHAYKPHLARAMKDLLPPETAARTTKGSFDADHYTGLRTNLPALSALADGHLAALGLVHAGRLRLHLAQAAAGLPMPLATLEQALAAEAWLTAHHRDPAPTWQRTPARSHPRA